MAYKAASKARAPWQGGVWRMKVVMGVKKKASVVNRWYGRECGRGCGGGSCGRCGRWV